MNRSNLVGSDEAICCSACSQTIERKRGSIQDSRLVWCVVCGTEDMYIQKDFPHRLGLTVVGLGIVLSSVAWWRYKYPLALGILVATPALDFLLYYVVGDATICYRCLAQYRANTSNRNPTNLQLVSRNSCSALFGFMPSSSLG